MSLLIYNSIWKGSQIDDAIGRILNSGITVGELGRVHEAEVGIAVPNKVLVLSSTKTISGIATASMTICDVNTQKFQVRTTDPTQNPEEGTVYMYYKDGDFWVKSDDGVTKKFGAAQQKVFTFDNTTSVTCNHKFGNQYPLVQIVGSDNKTLGGSINFDSDSTLYISFNSSRSGRIIVSLI